MCGISGIIDRSNTPIPRGEIEAMNGRIRHRGPDDEGFFLENNVALGHRRLSILDLSPEGHQPMHRAQRYVIVYNGEVYNYLELRDELITRGHAFTSHSDTEVILAAYEEWGEGCVSRFNGMWAFALYDRERQTLFCSRDRFGVKPFYYVQTPGRFAFGSEIKQLLPFLDERNVNTKILIDYLVLSYEEHTDETFFEGVFKLPPSHNLLYDLKTGDFTLQRYYTIRIDESMGTLEEAEAVRTYAASLEDAIKIRLRSDVKVGTCLSGGLDSSSVAAIAAKMYNTQDRSLSAVHAKSSEASNDESRWARTVADHCALDLNVIEPGADAFRACLEHVIRIQEEPFGSPSIIMQYLVFEEANRLGCKVMLDGQGGDETLMGYERYLPAYLLSLKGSARFRGFWLSFRHSKLTPWKLLQYFVYFTNTSIRLARLKKKLSFIKPEYFDRLSTGTLRDSARNYGNILGLQLLEITSTQLPHLLKYEDKNSMCHSVEARLPFVDYRNVENALAIRNDLKIHKGWTKYLLRRGVEKLLPFEVVWRKDKIGFEAPSATWLKAHAEAMEASVRNSPLLRTLCTTYDYSKLDAKTRWKLFNIAEWERIYDVKIN